MKKYLIIIVSLILIAIGFIAAINFYVLSFSEDGYYASIDQVEKKYVGLVLGASVIASHGPSAILKDRLDVAYEVYRNGKVEKIIVSGDNRALNYNEPIVMQKYLINKGVDADDIYLDYAGFDTYDSIYRAQKIFGVEELSIFTQDFHLKRAIYIAKRLGMNPVGISTNIKKYKNEDYNNTREILARVKAFLEVEILQPEPTYLGDSIEIITDEKIGEVKKELLKQE